MARTPMIQIQRGNFRNFFLNHFGFFEPFEEDDGGGGMLLTGLPFKHAYSHLVVEGTDD